MLVLVLMLENKVIPVRYLFNNKKEGCPVNDYSL